MSFRYHYDALMNRRTSRGAGGGGSAAPPAAEIMLFFGQIALNSGNDTWEKAL